MVEQAEGQNHQHRQFGGLLAECERDARSSRRSNVSLLDLHRGMASSVRDKLIQMAKAKIKNAGSAGQKELKLKLVQQLYLLTDTNKGWQNAWGVVDRALSGLNFFCGRFHIPLVSQTNQRIIATRVPQGRDEAIKLRCFHDVQDLWYTRKLSV